MQHSRRAGHTTEQRTRIQTHTFNTTLMQQAVKAALLFTFGKESRVTHLNSQFPALPGLNKADQFCQTLRSETRR